MSSRNSGFPVALALLCLIILGAMLGGAILKDRTQEIKKPSSGLMVLGDKSAIDNFVKDTLEATRENLSAKAVEVQKNIVATLEREVSELTQSQIEAVKVQICRDWGVITPVPTNQP